MVPRRLLLGIVIATLGCGGDGTTRPSSTNAPNVIATGIVNADEFIDRCPTLDAAYNEIRRDFEIRSDGALVTAGIACKEPFSAQTSAQVTDELIALQTLRTAFYMSAGTAGKLPWTPKSLWAWMTTNVKGVNLKAAPGLRYCCDVIGGQKYFAQSRRGPNDSDYVTDWTGISATLAFYAHEIRHADPGSPLHTGGCFAFPSPTAVGCDESYDLANIGGYGVQFWLQQSWATGYLNVGIACARADRAREVAMWHVGTTNTLRWRFVTNVPSPVIVGAPFGGNCLTGRT